VQAVFDMPLAAHGGCEQLCVEWQGGQIVALFQAGAAISLDFGLDVGDGASPESGARLWTAGGW